MILLLLEMVLLICSWIVQRRLVIALRIKLGNKRRKRKKKRRLKEDLRNKFVSINNKKDIKKSLNIKTLNNEVQMPIER